jgi:hypothetical protein
MADRTVPAVKAMIRCFMISPHSAGHAGPIRRELRLPVVALAEDLVHDCGKNRGSGDMCPTPNDLYGVQSVIHGHNSLDRLDGTF